MFPISCLVYSINHRVCLLTTIRLENITHNVCYVLRLHPWNEIVIDHKFLATNAIFGIFISNYAECSYTNIFECIQFNEEPVTL